MVGNKREEFEWAADVLRAMLDRSDLNADERQALGMAVAVLDYGLGDSQVGQTKQQQQQLEMRERQAKFWHAFAWLAVHGKRTVEDYYIAKLTDPPDAEQVEAIRAEAAEVRIPPVKA